MTDAERAEILAIIEPFAAWAAEAIRVLEAHRSRPPQDDWESLVLNGQRVTVGQFRALVSLRNLLREVEP